MSGPDQEQIDSELPIDPKWTGITVRDLRTFVGRLTIGSALFIVSLICGLGIIVYNAAGSNWLAIGEDVATRGAIVDALESDTDQLFENETQELAAEAEKLLILERELWGAYQELRDEPSVVAYYRNLYAQGVDSIARTFGPMEQSPIRLNLREGWNMISYSGKPGLHPRETFSNILRLAGAVRDESDNEFNPTENIDQITTLSIGAGYMMFMRRDTVFAFSR